MGIPIFPIRPYPAFSKGDNKMASGFNDITRSMSGDMEFPASVSFPFSARESKAGVLI